MDVQRYVLSATLLLGLMLLPREAMAIIEMRSYSTYLNSAVLDSTSKEITLYAGRTGNECTANNPSFTNSTGTCDSCAKNSAATVGTVPCNSREIHVNLPFSITLRSDQTTDYPNGCSRVLLGRLIGGTTYFEPDTITAYQPGVVGQDVTATFNWSKICQQASESGSSACDKSFSSRFEFSFDPQCNQTAISTGGPQFTINFRYVATSPAMSLGCPVGATGAFEGICSYSIFPGDGKVFIKDPQGMIANEFYVPDLQTTATNSKDPSNMKYSHFRVYYKEGSIAGGTAGTITQATPFKDLAISGTKLSDERVTGLTNETPYVFLGAMVDQAGNVTHFAQPASLQVGVHEGKPEQVYGLLDNKGCFVATAAYGTPQAREIQILRDFRDVSLAKTELGRSFIRFYYRHSPGWAAVIRENETLRAFVRTALSPVIWSAEKILEWAYHFHARDLKTETPAGAAGSSP